MKKLNLVLLSVSLLISIYSTAQLNYLFSAEKKPYVPVTGGISPTLLTNFGGQLGFWTAEDEGFANVPIGFTFNYNGRNITTVNVCANGFVTLGDTITRNTISRLWENSLAHGPFGFVGHKPVLAPFWDDLDLVDTHNLVYKTTGHYPNRVFTVEWKKVKWTFESTAPALSIQLRLYEKTNIIEFHYKDEGGMPFISRAFASIGITSSYNNRGFISLQNASSNPSISLLRANDSLTLKPANKQVYRFTPAPADIPDALEPSISYTNKTVSFDLESGRHHGHHWDNDDDRNGYDRRDGHDGHDGNDGHNGHGEHNGHYRHDSYEYAITRSPIPPLYGRKTSSSEITISSLSPATTYYLYARSVERDQRYSQWTCDSFTTAVNPVTLPYHLAADASVYPYFPADMRIQDFMDTTFHYYPNSDAGWNVITDFPNFGDTSMYALNTLFGYDGDSWIFTPGLKLTEGKIYQLKFGYLSYASQAPGPGEISSIEVKYGKATGEAGMTSGTLFKRTDILTDFNEEGWIDFEDTIIEVKPRRSGVYYFGFHNLTTLNNGQPGPVPVIGNISISEKEESCLREAPITLNGKTNNTDNFLNWQTPAGQEENAYEVQSSTDGVHFSKIAEVNAEIAGSTTSQKPRVHYKIVQIVNEPELTNAKAGYSKTADKRSIINDTKRFELQRSEDGVHFSKISAGKPISSRTTKEIKSPPAYYTDRKVTKGVIYYRLLQTGKNGILKYSNIVTLETKGISIHKIYPNPVVSMLNIEVESPDAGKVNLLITDINGKTVINKPVQVWQGTNNLQLAVGNLHTGSYIIKVVCAKGCESAVKKFIKE